MTDAVGTGNTDYNNAEDEYEDEDEYYEATYNEVESFTEGEARSAKSHDAGDAVDNIYKVPQITWRLTLALLVLISFTSTLETLAPKQR